MRCVLLFLSVLAVASARELLGPKPPKCQLPKATCGGYCANLNSDLAHCGKCDNACRPGEACGGNPKRCKCGSVNNTCASDQVCCTDICRTSLDLQTDVNHCGACGNACPAGNICDVGVCKCTASSQCPDATPICGADGVCTLCSYAGDKGAPCAIRAAALGVTTFQCDYPEANLGAGTGSCVECNIENRAGDNDCAFLITHSLDPADYPAGYEAAANIPRIDAALTYCGADSTCTTPPL